MEAFWIGKKKKKEESEGAISHIIHTSQNVIFWQGISWCSVFLLVPVELDWFLFATNSTRVRGGIRTTRGCGVRAGMRVRFGGKNELKRKLWCWKIHLDWTKVEKSAWQIKKVETSIDRRGWRVKQRWQKKPYRGHAEGFSEGSGYL